MRPLGGWKRGYWTYPIKWGRALEKRLASKAVYPDDKRSIGEIEAERLAMETDEPGIAVLRLAAGQPPREGR